MRLLASQFPLRLIWKGLFLASNIGSINPFIVALISQPQSISLLKLAMDQKLLVGSQQNQ